jgi:hypothetical protein
MSNSVSLATHLPDLLSKSRAVPGEPAEDSVISVAKKVLAHSFRHCLFFESVAQMIGNRPLLPRFILIDEIVEDTQFDISSMWIPLTLVWLYPKMEEENIILPVLCLEKFSSF